MRKSVLYLAAVLVLVFVLSNVEFALPVTLKLHGAKNRYKSSSYKPGKSAKTVNGVLVLKYHGVRRPIYVSTSPQKTGPTTKTYRTYQPSQISHEKLFQKEPPHYKRYMQAYARTVLYYNPYLTEQQVDTIVRSILQHSGRYGVDPRMVVAVIACESTFNVRARSHAGAQGLGQLMPGTAYTLGVTNAYEPSQNIEGTVLYLKQQMNRWRHLPFQKRMEFTLAAYNAGPGAVQKYGGIPPYAETQNYVRKVIYVWRQLCGSK